MVVADASALVAALIDGGTAGKWAESIVQQNHLVAPHLVIVETAAILRRAGIAGDITPDVASMAYGDLLRLPVELLPFGPFAERIWELRENVTPYDAWYVAVAEAGDVPLVTLDLRLARATGPRCEFWTPQD